MLMRRGYVDVDFGQIHYREAGEGTPLVLLHKTPASSTMYERVVPHLAEHFRTLAVDTPGFGMSDQLPKQPGPSLAPYRDAMIQFMDGLEIDRAHLLGHSTGAGIAVEIAAHHSDRVGRLVIATTPAAASKVDQSGMMAAIHEGVSSSWLQPVEMDSKGEFLEEYPLGPLRSLLVGDDPEEFLLQLVAYLQALPHYWWVAEGVLAVPGTHALFSRLRCPTLVINPREGLSYAATKKAHEHIPGSTYVELPGTTEVTMDFPQEFAAAVLAFLLKGR